MFLQNLGYRWHSLGKVDAGTIFRAGSLTSAMAMRRGKDAQSELLFDPQLYFLDMHVGPEKHKELLAKLATYPWFGMNAPKHDSGEIGVVKWAKDILKNIHNLWKKRADPHADWASTVKACVEFQRTFGVTTIILPSGLLTTVDAVDDFMADLDDAIASATSTTELPLYASVVIDESVVRLSDPASGTFIEALVDAISAREGLSGVYLAIAMAAPIQERFTHKRTVGALLRLCKLFANSNIQVVVNFAESLGLVCLALGARAYGTGYSTKDRRLFLGDYIKRRGGAALPKFFSKNLILDLRPEADMERLQKAGLLSMVKEDETPASASLFKVLGAGKKSSTVFDWQQEPNRTKAAELHYLQLHHREGAGSATVSETLQWLKDAEAAWAVLEDKFKNKPLTCEGAHIGVWRDRFEACLK